MLLLLSPSKALDFDRAAPAGLSATRPRFAKDTAELLERLSQATPSDLKRLMGISDALAELNVDRCRNFESAPRRPAIIAFDGDVYKGFEAHTLSREDLEAAQERVRILSGLYGLLRPLDAIAPYRLEMGTRLSTERGADLYDFWGARLAEALDRDLRGAQEPCVINLASDEYVSAVDRKALKAPMITLSFKDVKDGKARALFIYLKHARGAMARFAVQNRIDRPEGLKDFTGGGYRFDPTLSNPQEWVFTRPQPAAKSAPRRAEAARTTRR